MLSKASPKPAHSALKSLKAQMACPMTINKAKNDASAAANLRALALPPLQFLSKAKAAIIKNMSETTNQIKY
jgi:hypothetical protein